MRQMCAEQRRIEHDALVVRSQPIAEIDILDLRAWIAHGVESTDGKKCITTYRATARPERLGVPRRARVHIAMQQVPILRNESPMARRIVVRAEGGAQCGIPREECGETAQRRRRDNDIGIGIGIDEHQHAAAGDARTHVPRERRATWATVDDEHTIGDGARQVTREQSVQTLT